MAHNYNSTDKFIYFYTLLAVTIEYHTPNKDPFYFSRLTFESANRRMDVRFYKTTDWNRFKNMIKQKKEYIRLPGKVFLNPFLRKRARLYMGKDHLLCVNNIGYTESYKRFYYKDIQAITVYKTADSIIWSVFFAICTSISILIALMIDSLTFSIVFVWIPVGLFLVLFLVNVLRGPTCITHLYSAVTKEKLLSLSRMRSAQSVMNTLRPFIDTAQGTLSGDALNEHVDIMTGKSTVEIKPRIVSRKESKSVPYYDGRYHEILFFLLFLWGAQDLTKFFFNHSTLTLFGWVVGLGIGIVVIFAIVKQHNSLMKEKGWLVGITWATLGYLFLYFYINYFIIIFTSGFKDPEIMQNQRALLDLHAYRLPLDNPYIMSFYIVSIVYAFTSVTLGLILLRRYKHEIARHR